VDEHRNFREGAKRLVWRTGWPRVLHNERDQRSVVERIYPSSYAVGGLAAFDREKFAELGGFDPLFEPFYWEDVDLSLRAAERGWHCAYLPECVVRHAGHSGIRSTHDQEYIREITMRNRLLFAWRHGSAVQRSLLEMALVWHRLNARVTGDKAFGRALRAARERRQSHLHSNTRASAVTAHGAPVDR
jgi:GT2 family glycosyltransferase